jgi:hypothetical protein
MADYDPIAGLLERGPNDGRSSQSFPVQQSRNARQGEGVLPMADYRKMFDDFRNTMEENRRQMEIDVDYYHGKQLTVQEKRVLSTRGQPDIVINRVRVAINGILGVLIQSKADPRAWPRTPNDEDAADVGTDVLRYIAQRSRFGQVKSEAAWNMFVPGVGACIIEVDDDGNVMPRLIDWKEYFWDPRAKRRDKSDALYQGVAKWMYADDVERKYNTTISLSYSGIEGVGGAVDTTFQDRPLNQGGWLDTRNRRVMVVEVYHRYNGQWYRCVFYAGGVLEEGVSPYVDDKKRPICPIEAMTAYIDDDNQNYGLVRDMRDIQDEINKRRSKLLHLVNSHQIQAKDPSAIEVDANEARKEAARPDGVIPYGWEIVRTTDMSAGQMQLLSEAKNEMERLGPNPAVLGRQGSDTSGRAILARQQAGLVELAVVLDQIDDWELRCYHQMWWRARQFWRDEMWVRVTDDPDTPRFIQLNRPKGQLMPVMDPATGQQATNDNGEPLHQESEPVFHPPGVEEGSENPMAGQSVFGYDNDLGEMDIDIIVDTQPETANIMQEMRDSLIKLVMASPKYAAEIPFTVFLELSPMPRKRLIMDQIKAYQAQQQQQQAQQQQVVQSAQLAKLKAEIEEMQAKAYNLIATAEAAMIKVGVEQKEALTASAAAATVAVGTLHDVITDHVDQQQRQQELAQAASSEDTAAAGQAV